MTLLEYALKKNFKTKSEAANHIKKGFFLVNKTACKDQKYSIKPEDSIEYFHPKPEIPVLFQHDDFLIVYKPPKLSVARTSTTAKTDYVLNELVAEKYVLSEAEKEEEFGLPHRLDKETQGLMFLTKKNYENFREFLPQINKKYIGFLNHQEPLNTTKLYHFLCKHNFYVFSLFPHCFCQEFDEAPTLSLSLEYKGRKTVLGTKTQSNTKILLSENQIVAFPLTGRKHQIRVVSQYMKKPILGDKMYGGAKHDHLALYAVAYRFPLKFF